MTTMNLQIWPAIARNVRSLGEAFLLSVIRYPWIPLLGAFAGYLLGEVRTQGSQNAMSLYWILSVATLVALAFVGCRHTAEVITRSNQAYPTIGRGIKYLLVSFLLIVLVMGVALVGSLFGLIGVSGEFGGGVTIWTLVIALSWIVAIYISSRLILVMPAIAVGNSQTSFRRSWNLTKGYEWRVITILFSTYFIMTLVMKIPDLLSDYLLGGDLLGMLLGGAILWWSQAVITIFMSEVTGRLFVFFHKPDIYHDYLK